MRIAVCDPGMGNLKSVLRALEKAVPGASAVLTADPDAIRKADAVVMPGQGAFGPFARAVDQSGLREALLESIAAGKKYLGICLGMQALFEESDEAPGARGLGVFEGRVTKLAAPVLPHMGWNEVSTGGFFYFAHSFVVQADPSVIRATTDYGETFTSVVGRDNVLGVQFHPEKSQRAGLSLIEGFFR